MEAKAVCHRSPSFQVAVPLYCPFRHNNPRYDKLGKSIGPLVCWTAKQKSQHAWPGCKPYYGTLVQNTSTELLPFGLREKLEIFTPARESRIGVAIMPRSVRECTETVVNCGDWQLA
jgi:hypothetical protein